MLTTPLIEQILTSLPKKTIGLVGDLFLDRYLDIDAALNEPSVETGLTAYQVTRVRSYPGALGTVLNNLCALGVGRILPVSVIGDDGEGYELMQALRKMPNVDLAGIITTPDRRTPTYCKPMLTEGGVTRELNRLDTKNRVPLSEDVIDDLYERISEMFEQCDGVIVLDQVSEENCGVINDTVRNELSQLAVEYPAKFVLADSREWIEYFQFMCVKPNQAECAKAGVKLRAALENVTFKGDDDRINSYCLFNQVERPVFMTAGPSGTLVVYEKEAPQVHMEDCEGYPVAGQIDICGAGDSCSAGITSAMVCGTTPLEAAAFGNLVASITIQQIGTTGTATPDQVRQRWREVMPKPPHP